MLKNPYTDVLAGRLYNGGGDRRSGLYWAVFQSRTECLTLGLWARAGYSVAIAFQDEQKERHIKE